MLIAIPEWNKRISPVFDEALHFKFYRIQAGEVSEIADHELPALLTGRQIDFLAEAEVNILICGAISRHLQREAERNGIRVIPFLAGETELVIQEWLSGGWQQGRHYMPGCGRRQWREDSSSCPSRGNRGNRDKTKHSRR
ncbi:MAG: NifB/NifX family molybdenum-iron cluster-binding protein [Candidatus Stygibacter australis]|nr:NifB/NifX family molybdenum-iron cluster-binding protein [Candidatus Stygibacter australis]MDP8320798.1 NifB/NifX family molybdenum-iron cluster-binding protein [Candidatus Stygibacter australis]